MPRKIILPPRDRLLVEVDGWGVFRHPPTAADSPLWLCLKIIDLGAVGRRHRRGRLRVFWLYWGIDERRFRRSAHQRAFEQQQSAVAAVISRRLAELEPEFLGEIELRLGEIGLARERARLSQSRLLHEAHDARREAAARAALEKLF